MQSINLLLEGRISFALGDELGTEQKHGHLTGRSTVFGEKTPAVRNVAEIRQDSVPLRKEPGGFLRTRFVRREVECRQGIRLLRGVGDRGCRTAASRAALEPSETRKDLAPEI